MWEKKKAVCFPITTKWTVSHIQSTLNKKNKKKRGKVGEKWCANVIGLVTSEVLTRCGCDQINKLLSSRRSQSIVTHYPELAGGCQSTPWFFTEWVAEEERGFVPALIWHGVESKVKARRAALHLTAWGEVGKLFLQKPREHRSNENSGIQSEG